jgi:hypothetical protein
MPEYLGKNMSKKSAETPEKNYVRACPKCSSKDLSTEPGISIYILFGYVYQYRCHNCGYFGPNFDLVEETTDFPVEPEKAV